MEQNIKMMTDLKPLIEEYKEKNSNKTRFYRRIRNIGTIVTSMVLIGLTGILVYKDYSYSKKDLPEEFHNFKKIQNIKNYKIKSNTFTKGDIIDIEMLDNEKYVYDTLSMNPEEIAITVKFKYGIKSERQFLPKDENHSDFYGNTLENQGKKYWEATREGTITLEKKLK